ncbi:uncharacterized protein [Oryctolagus cuniculus]|uniref:uncharacterized protein isoform X3 n=1 Tax=Oryctolagus cuniculus TaxID=9986 RepID=UPI0038792094
MRQRKACRNPEKSILVVYHVTCLPGGKAWRPILTERQVSGAPWSARTIRMAVPLSPSSDPANKNNMVVCNQASRCRLAENQREIQDLKEIVRHFSFILHQEENNYGEGQEVIQSRLREKPALGTPQLEKLAPAEFKKCHVNKARTRKRCRLRKKSRKQTQISHLSLHPRALLTQHDPDSHHKRGLLEPLVVHVRLEKHLVYKCSLAKEMTQMKGGCWDLICPSRISGCFPPQVEPELVPGLIMGEYCWCIVMKAKLVMQQHYPGGGWTIVLEECSWCTRFGVYGNSLEDRVPHEAKPVLCESRSLAEGHRIMACTHLADAPYMWHASWGDKLEILFQAWARVQQPLAQQSIHWIEAIEGYDTSSQKDEVVSADRAEVIPRVCGDPPPLEGPDTIVPILKEDGSYLLCGFWADEPEAPAQAWSETVKCTIQQPLCCAEAIVVEDLSYKKEEGEVATAVQTEPIPRVCGDPPPLERPDVILPILKDDRSYMLCGYWADGSETPVQVSAEPWHLTTQQPICCAEAIVVEDASNQKEKGEVASPDLAEANLRVCGDPPPLEGPDVIVPILKDDGSYMLCGFWADDDVEAPIWACAGAWNPTTQQPICCAEAIVVENPYHQKEEVELASTDQAEAIPRVCGDPPPLEGPDAIVPVLKDDGSYLLCAYWADEPEAPDQAWARAWHFTTRQPLCCAEAIVVEDSSNKKEKVKGASSDQAEAMSRVGEDPPPLEGPDVIVPIFKGDGSYLLCGFWADESEAPAQACAEPWHLATQKPICCAEAIAVEDPSCKKEEGDSASAEQAEAIPRVCGDPPPLEGPDAIVPILKEDGSYLLCGYWADEPEAPVQAWAGAWHFTTQQPICSAEDTLEPSFQEEEGVVAPADQAEANQSLCSASHLRVCEDPPPLEGPDVIVPILKDDGSYMLCAIWMDDPEAPVQAWAGAWHPTTQQPICCAEAIVVKDATYQKEKVMLATADWAEATSRVCGDPPPLEGPDVIVPILKDDGSYLLCAYWADEPEAPVQAWAGALHPTAQQPICCVEAIMVEDASSQKEKIEVASAEQTEATPRVGGDPPPLEGPDVIVPILKDDGSYLLCAYWADEPEAPVQAWAGALHPTAQQPICCAEAILVEEPSSQEEEGKVARADQAEANQRVCGDPPPLEGPDVIVPILKDDGSYLLCGYWADEPEAPAQVWAEAWHAKTQQPICCAEAFWVLRTSSGGYHET